MSLSNFSKIGSKIICVGRNYRDHVFELNNILPNKPLLFSKTKNSYLLENEGKICFPPNCSNLHYEVELGVIFNEKVKYAKRTEAMKYVGGYAIALDMTARDLQDDLKKLRYPWFIAKSFDTSCPVGNFILASKIQNPHNIEIYCKVNNEYRQKSLTNNMIFSIPTLIEYASSFITFERGDLLLTGTPAGVNSCKSGDCLEIGITDITKSTFFVE